MIRSLCFSCQRLALALLGVVAFSPLAWGQKAPSPPISSYVLAATDPHVRQLVAANTDFGFKMLAQLSRSAPSANVFFSPFGLTSALTMALAGAGGETRRDMAATLGLGAMTPDQINQANSLLLPSLTRSDPGVELSVASALWAGRGTAFSPTFQQAISSYHAHAESLDFASPSAADTINGWVKENTHGKIDHLVSAPDLVGMNGFLTNAVYFHGTWQNKFPKAATQDGPFTLEDGTMKTLPLMSQVETFPFLETSDFQAVSLPYQAGRLSLYVFLPKPGRSLDGFVSGLNANAWEGWIVKMQTQSARVAITLPRFKVNYQTALNQPLTVLGMGSAFAPSADFTPMGVPGASRGSFFSGAVQEAILEVDEDGTVAAAVTGFGLGGGGPVAPPTVMRVDHPFFCAIRDNLTGTVLFAGVIRDPG